MSVEASNWVEGGTNPKIGELVEGADVEGLSIWTRHDDGALWPG